MSNTAQFNIAMMLRLSGQAETRAGLAGVEGGLKGVSAEATKASTAAGRQSDVLHVLSGASTRAAASLDDLLAATTPISNVWRGAETSAEALRGSVAGLNASVGQQAHDFVAARQEAALYQQMLDDVRASFNPLFAASRQYEQQLDRIAEAERIGAINALEAADARRRAAAIIAPPASVAPLAAGAVNSMHTANIGAQGFDIGVTAAMGMNPAMIGLQQGTQIAQVVQQLGGGKEALLTIGKGMASIVAPMTLATIAFTALGAAGIQALMGLAGEVKTLDDAMDDLEGSTDAYAKSIDRARMSSASLRAEFGSMSQIARQLLQDMAALDRRTAGRDASAVLKALPRDIGLSLQDPDGEADDLRRRFGLSTWKQESWDMAREVRDSYLGVTRADGLDAQIAAVQRLKEAYTAAAEAAGGITKDEDQALGKIQTALDTLTSLKARDENAAGIARADEMIRQLQQRSALEAVSLRYGQDSAEYRAEENRQARETLLLELERAGIDRNSDKAREGLRANAEAAMRREAVADKARSDAQRDYAAAQQDQIDGLQSELNLLGASNEERIRANALAEADAEIRRRSLSIEDARETRSLAIARAEAQIRLEREKAARAAQLDSRMDALDGQIGLARDPITRAVLEAQREYTRVLHETGDAERATAAATRARNRVMTETVNAARVQIADMLDEVAVRQQVAAQVAAGTIQASEANRVIQQELQLRPLVAAAARAEGAEKQRLTEIVTGLRLAHEAQAAEDRRQAQTDFLRATAERIQQAQLELALIGQTAQVRARVLAMVQAERDIRAQGLTGAVADDHRAQIRKLTEMHGQIERLGGAWDTVQQAGESAIDAVLDKLRDGDIRGAFAGLLDELNKGFFDLAVRNPLKNLILGTDLGTLDDIGGLSGIIARLTGQAPLNEKAVVGAASAQVQAMQVAAAAVTINAASLTGAQGLLGTLTGAANINASPLTDGSGVARQIWDFFTGKGLAPHQVAAIVGHAKAESGLNPLAIGDGGDAYGLFQWNDRRHSLFDFLGGKQNLGNVNGQLEFAWKELMTTENGPFRRLMAAPDLASATWAWQGFERPEGYNAGAFGSGMHFDRRLAGAEQALVTFTTGAQQASTTVGQMGQTSLSATTQLGKMGQGMGQFGGLLGQLASGVAGSVGGNAGGILSILLGIGGQLSQGVPLFSAGGATGGTDPARPAGIVHEAEYVFDAESTRRIGVSNLEALRKGTIRQFRQGGFVGPAPAATVSPANSPWAEGGNVTFAPSFDLRGAQDPAATEAAARRGMDEALKIWSRQALPGHIRKAMAKPRNL